MGKKSDLRLRKTTPHCIYPSFCEKGKEMSLRGTERNNHCHPGLKCVTQTTRSGVDCSQPWTREARGAFFALKNGEARLHVNSLDLEVKSAITIRKTRLFISRKHSTYYCYFPSRSRTPLFRILWWPYLWWHSVNSTTPTHLCRGTNWNTLRWRTYCSFCLCWECPSFLWTCW